MPDGRKLRAAWRFALVGTVGFVIDAAVLSLMTTGAGWSPLRARGLSFACAVTATWLLNRHYTFSHRRLHSLRGEYARYVLTQGFGAAVNFLVFAAGIAASSWLRHYPVVPLAIASIVAMGVNFGMMQWLVFPRAANADVHASAASQDA